MQISFNITQKGRLQVLADILKDKGKTIFSLNLKKENYTFLLAEEMKKVISDGNVLIPLKESTKDIRRRRKGIAFKSMTKPLYATGALHDSIKATKDGVEMKGYGIQHAMGFKTDFKSMIPNKEVPRRRFHLAVMNEKTANRIRNEIKENVSEGLRKAIGAGMVTKIGS